MLRFDGLRLSSDKEGAACSSGECEPGRHEWAKVPNRRPIPPFLKLPESLSCHPEWTGHDRGCSLCADLCAERRAFYRLEELAADGKHITEEASKGAGGSKGNRTSIAQHPSWPQPSACRTCLIGMRASTKRVYYNPLADLPLCWTEAMLIKLIALRISKRLALSTLSINVRSTSASLSHRDDDDDEPIPSSRLYTAKTASSVDRTRTVQTF